MKKNVRYRFEGLNLKTTDRLLAKKGGGSGSSVGLPLRAAENVVWDGPIDEPHLRPLPDRADLYTITSLGDPVAMGWHVRQRAGDLDTNGDGLSRLIVVCKNGIKSVWATNPSNPLSSSNVSNRTLVTWGGTAARTASFAQVGESLIITVAKSGVPEFTYMLVDDVLFNLLDSDSVGRTPRNDAVSASPALVDDGGLPPGYYGFAWAYSYRDGTVGPLSGFVGLANLQITSGSNFDSGSASAGATSITLTPSTSVAATIAELDLSARFWEKHQGDRRPRVSSYATTEEMYVVESYSASGGNVILTLGNPVATAISGSVYFVGGSQVTFTIANAPAFGDTSREELIEGLRLYLTPPLQLGDDLLGTPYYLAGTIKDPSSSDTLVWSGSAAELIAQPAYEAGTLAANDIKASRCFVFNSQLYLGDVSYDFPLPGYFSCANTTGSGDTVWVEAVIRTAGGVYYRYEEVTVSSDTSVLVRVRYPDRRCEKINFYTDDGGGNYDLSTSIALTPSPFYDIAYSVETLVNMGTPSGAEIAGSSTRDDRNAEVDRDRNRVLVSETYRPFDLRAGSAGYVGESESDAVQGFAVAQAALSRGQFGQFPLLVFLKGSVWAWQPSVDGPVSIRPVTTDRGLISPQGLLVASGRVFFVSYDGVWSIGEGGLGTEPITAPVWHTDAGDASASGLNGKLTASTALVRFNQKDGRDEMWVTTASSIYIYSFKYRRWTRGDIATPSGRVGGDFLAAPAPEIACFARSIPGEAVALYSAGVKPGGDKNIFIECAATSDVDVRIKTARLWDEGMRSRFRRIMFPHVARADIHYILVDNDPAGEVVIAEGDVVREMLGTYYALPLGHAWAPHLELYASLPVSTKAGLLDGFEVEIHEPSTRRSPKRRYQTLPV